MSFNPFDIAEQQYKASKEPVQEQTQQPSVKKASVSASNDLSSSFSPFDVAQQIYDVKQPEGWWDSTLRNITRTGSRMAETVLGLPGDIANFTKGAMANFPGAGGLAGQFIEKTAGEDAWRKAVAGKSKFLGSIPDIGQEELQQLSEAGTGGFTTPRSGGEEISDEVTKTFTNLLTGRAGVTPIKGASKLPAWGQSVARLGRELGTSIAAESAKEGIKLYGGSPDQQEAGKLASLFLLGMTLPRLTRETAPDQYLTSLYQKRDELIPTGTMVTPTGIQHGIENFINSTLKYGGPTPEKKQVLSTIEPFLDKVKGRAIEMKEVLQMYRDINRNRSAVMAATDLDKAGVKTARKYWGEAAKIFNDNIEGYLSVINPEALNLHRSANSGWAALNKSNVVSEYVMDKMRGVPLKTGIATLFGGGIFYPSAAVPALAGAAAGATASKGWDLAARFLKNPTLRHYYTQVIENASRENAPGTIRSLKKLDEEYEKSINQRP